MFLPFTDDWVFIHVSRVTVSVTTKATSCWIVLCTNDIPVGFMLHGRYLGKNTLLSIWAGVEKP